MRRVSGMKVVRPTLGGLPFCSSAFIGSYLRREALEGGDRSQQRPLAHQNVFLHLGSMAAFGCLG